jgi:hypothetical protein
VLPALPAPHKGWTTTFFLDVILQASLENIHLPSSELFLYKLCLLPLFYHTEVYLPFLSVKFCNHGKQGTIRTTRRARSPDFDIETLWSFEERLEGGEEVIQLQEDRL